MSRGPVPDAETQGLGVRYRIPRLWVSESGTVRGANPVRSGLGSGIKILIKRITVYKLFWHLMTVKSVGNLLTDAILTGALTLAVTRDRAMSTCKARDNRYRFLGITRNDHCKKSILILFFI